MYIVAIENDGVLTEIHNSITKLASGSVVKGINTIDSFSFTVLPSSKCFNMLHDMKTLVTVYNTNRDRYEFRGRVLYTSTEMTDDGMITKSVTCESLFGYLCDSQQEYIKEQRWTVRGLLEHIINCHNSWLEAEKHFVVDVVEVEDPNDTLYCGIQRENTWETIKKKMIDVLGGEIQYRVKDNIIYLDYLNEIGEKKDAPIALSMNMKSITQERDPSSYITRLIPLGTKIYEDSEERLTIASVNGGKIYIDDEQAVKAYGIHVGYLELDDVTTPRILLNRGKSWLKANGKISVKYSIDALDLSLIGYDIDDFDIGNSHPIKNALIGVDDTARIIKKKIDISDATKDTIEVGEKFKTMPEIQKDNKTPLDKMQTDIDNIKASYVTDETMKKEIQVVTEQIENNNKEKIDSLVQTTTSTTSGGTNVWTATFGDGTTSTLEVRNGEKGKDGEDGEDGEDGKTPVKGTDYFTEEDKKEIVDSVLEEIKELIQQVEDNIPTHTSDLINDSGYVSESTVQDLIEEALDGTGTGGSGGTGADGEDGGVDDSCQWAEGEGDARRVTYDIDEAYLGSQGMVSIDGLIIEAADNSSANAVKFPLRITSPTEIVKIVIVVNRDCTLSANGEAFANDGTTKTWEVPDGQSVFTVEVTSSNTQAKAEDILIVTK